MEGGRGGADAAYTADRRKMVSLHLRCESCNADEATRKPGSAPPWSSVPSSTSSFTFKDVSVCGGGVFAVTHTTCVHRTD